MIRTEVYILSRDRPLYCRQALESVIAACYGKAHIVLSDNSETDAIEDLVKSKYDGVRYIRRSPTLSVFDHHRAVIDECASEFVVFFHDDDIMLPGYLGRMEAALDYWKEAVAVGCNALIIRLDGLTKRRFMGDFAAPQLIRGSKSLLDPYLSISATSHAPFPSYMYRSEAIRGTYLLASEGGKHADVSFLTKLLGKGPILWLPDVLMHYRVHANNGSRAESIGDRLSWLRYLVAHDGVDRKSRAFQDFRFRFWTRWYLQRFGGVPWHVPGNWRERVVLRYILATGSRLALTRPILWRKWLRRFF